MAHELLGERFFSYRQPAWHALGTVSDKETTAREAYETIGTIDVQKLRLFTSDGLETEFDAIVREATHDDPVRRVFGVVNKKYELVTPGDVVDNWDRAVSRYVETMGLLEKGSTLFVTTKLPTVDINGDELENYMVLI